MTPLARMLDEIGPAQSGTDAHHSAGFVRLDNRILTLEAAEHLWRDTGADFLIAARARDRAVHLGLTHEILPARTEMHRLSKLENDLKRAIVECAENRRAAGYADPHDPDRARLRVTDKTGGDD